MSITVILGIIGAAIVALLGIFFKGQSAGANKERVKQAEERQKANTIADQVDNDIGAVPPAKQREELKKWSKS
jgi:hypothetical protein